MIDILLDTCLDSLRMLPFLFVAFLIIELIEHKFSDKASLIISKSGRFGPFLGSVLGAIPQCGFSVLATHLYVTHIVTIGTLIAIYLSTSDEMLPVLLSHNVPLIEIAKLIGLKVIIGMVCGCLIDFLLPQKAKQDFHICEESECECEKSLLKSTLVHTFKTLFFIFIFTLLLNILLANVDEEIIKNHISQNKWFAPFLCSLIGLIPNCASSIMLTELYLNGIISIGSVLAGLLTGSGVAIMILFKANKNQKENMQILAIIYGIGVISGIIINLIGEIL